MTPATCEQIQTQLSELYHCTRDEEFLRIHTPFLFPDGDHIDIFAVEKDNAITLTDYGETLRWLRMQTPAAKRTPKQNQIISDICLNHGVEFYKGMLAARVESPDQFASVLMRISQASLRVSDIWFSFRTRSPESLNDDVEELFRERDVSFQRREKLPGRSGTIWTPDFHARVPERSSLIYVLSTGSKAAAKNVRDHVVAAWYDLNHYRVGPEALQFISLFDDTMDVWSQEDFALLNDLSVVTRWSQPDELMEILHKAA